MEVVWIVERAEAKVKCSQIKEWEATHPKPKKNDSEWKAEEAIPKPRLYQKTVDDTGESSGEDFDLDVSSEDDEEK